MAMEYGFVLYAGEGAHAMLQLRERDGRLVVRELVVRADRVSGRLLNQIPLGRIEEVLNQPEMAAALRRELERAADGFEPGPTMADLKPSSPSPKVVLGRPRRKVRVPSGRSYPDEFYADVAAAYGFHAASGSSAAAAIAAEADVPRSTVHRWLKEARARGLLAPSSRARSKEKNA